MQKDFVVYFEKCKNNERVKTEFRCSQCGSFLELTKNQRGELFFSCSNWQNCKELFLASCNLTTNMATPIYR